MFLGTYAPRLDEKSRLIPLAKFRERFVDGLVLTKGQERCLSIWSLTEFRSVTEQPRQAPLTSKAVRDYMRVLFAGAGDEVPDKQGRICLPQHLRDYAGLDRDCAVIGAGRCVEVWDAAAWEHYLAAQEETFSVLSQEVLPGIL